MSSDVLGAYRNKFQGNAHDVARSVALEALTEIIYDTRESNDRNSVPTPTEYFVSIVTGLQGKAGPQHAPLMFLLSAVLGEVPRGILCRKGEACLEVIFQALKRNANDHQDDGEDMLLRNGITCIGIVLGSQEANKTTWDRNNIFQAYHILLGALSDDRPKIRKVAQFACTIVLEAHASCTIPYEALIHTCITSMSECTVNDVKFVQRLLSYLTANVETVTRHSPCKSVSSLGAKLIELVFLGNSQLSFNALKVLDGVCQVRLEGRGNDDKKLKDLYVIAENLIKVMKTGQRFVVNDIKVCTIWISCMKHCAVNIASHPLEGHTGVVKSSIDAMLSVLSMDTGQSAASSVPQIIVASGVLSDVIKAITGTITASELGEILDSMEAILIPQLEETWSLSLEIILAYFSTNRNTTDDVVVRENRIILRLVGIREGVINPVTGADKPNLVIRWRSAIHKVVASILISIGIERFLSLVPFAISGESGVSAKRLWILPIMRDNIHACTNVSLELFATAILATAEECEQLAQQDGIGPNTAKMLQNRMLQLWSLLPGFCTHPVDIVGGFSTIAPVLGQALEDSRYPELLEIVCSALHNLITASRTDDAAQQEVSSFSRIFLPLLFNLYDELVCAQSQEKATMVHNLISEYCMISNIELVNTLFKQLSQQLVVLTSGLSKASSGQSKKKNTNAEDRTKDSGSDDDSSDEEEEHDEDEDEDDDMEISDEMDEQRRQAHILSSLVLTLVPRLSSENISLLYRVVLPFLENEDDDALQKRGYRVLESICDSHANWVYEKRDQLVSVMQSSLFSASVSCKTARLKCLYSIVSAMAETANVASFTIVVQNIMGEVILSTKETNKKARIAGFRLLTQMNEAMRSVYARENQNGTSEFLKYLLGGLAAQTPHMRSAAVNSLCRVVSLIAKDPELTNDLVETSKTTLILLQEKSREIAKSCIGYAKVCATRLPVATLEQVLPDLLTALLPWANDTKNRFSLKIRVIMERLLKRIGLDAIVACNVIPADHKLLTYIRKQAAYKKRRYERKKHEFEENGRDAHDSEEDDEDDDLDGRKSNKRNNGRANRSRDMEEDIIMEAGDGEALDLMGAQAFSRVKRKVQNNRKTEEDDFAVTREGKWIIPGEDQDNEGSDASDDEPVSKKRRAKYDDDMWSDDEENTQARAQRKDKFGQGKKAQVEEAGKEQKKNKAGGDIRKKGNKLEPYAYIELNPKFLNKRRKHDALKQFRGIGGKKFQQSKKGKK